MVAIRKILACVDLSDYSKDTVDYAVTLGKLFNAEVVMFNVINKRDVDAVATAGRYYPGMVNVDAFLKRAKEDRLERIDELIASVEGSKDVTSTIRIQSGVPFEEILLAAQEEKVDLVVLGNKGRSNLARTLLGTNAEKVFRHCPVPVLNVRNPQKFGRR